MADTIASTPKLFRSQPEVAQQFTRFVDQWRQDTVMESDQSRILTHPAYFRLIGLGLQALPLIFRDLAAGGGPWFVALEAITGENPVPPEHVRNVRLMRQDWLDWARTRGYLDA